MISTTFTCIKEPRSIIHQQLVAGPVEKRVSVFIPPTLAIGSGPVGRGSLMWTEFIRDEFGMISALKVLVN
jgi:hypothetical protein